VIVNSVGLVLIGRNEAANLTGTLPVLRDAFDFDHIVYVDSGSTDDSVALARKYDIDVVELDEALPFTAARARNAGVRRLTEMLPTLDYIQFLDGDCELVPNYIDAALEHFKEHDHVGIVVGRNRERFPDSSIYNAICDVEWNTPVGELDACGGIFTIRQAVFEEIGGFDATLSAGEEPDLCLRLRQAGHQIHRIDHEMSLHDADMHQLGQWWTRMERTGLSFAEGRHRTRNGPETMYTAETRRSWIFGGYFFVAAFMAIFADWRWAALAAFFPAQAWRIKKNLPDRIPEEQKSAYAVSCATAYVPQLVGQVKFHGKRLMDGRS